MGVYNRDYMRDEDRAKGGVPSPRSWSVVTWIVVLTALYYLIDVLVFNNAHYGLVSPFNSRIRISLYQASDGGPPWICTPIRPRCSIDSSSSV